MQYTEWNEFSKHCREVTPTNPFTSNGIWVPISQGCYENLLACIQLLACSFQNSYKAYGPKLWWGWVVDETLESWPGPWGIRGAREKCTHIYPPTCTLTSSSLGAKIVLSMNFVWAFLILVSHKSREAFWPLLHVCHEDKVTGAWGSSVTLSESTVFSRHGESTWRASTLIYSRDRLRMGQRVGSGTRLINSCVWKKQMGLLAASGWMGPPSWCHPPCTCCCGGCTAGGNCWHCGCVASDVLRWPLTRPPGSQHHQADRYARQTNTLTDVFCFWCRVSRNAHWRMGNAGQAFHCPLSQLILGPINTHLEPFIAQSIISHPRLLCSCCYFSQERTKIKAFLSPRKDPCDQNTFREW